MLLCEGRIQCVLVTTLYFYLILMQMAVLRLIGGLGLHHYAFGSKDFPAPGHFKWRWELAGKEAQNTGRNTLRGARLILTCLGRRAGGRGFTSRHPRYQWLYGSCASYKCFMEASQQALYGSREGQSVLPCFCLCSNPLPIANTYPTYYRREKHLILRR